MLGPACFRSQSIRKSAANINSHSVAHSGFGFTSVNQVGQSKPLQAWQYRINLRSKQTNRVADRLRVARCRKVQAIDGTLVKTGKIKRFVPLEIIPLKYLIQLTFTVPLFLHPHLPFRHALLNCSTSSHCFACFIGHRTTASQPIFVAKA